MELNEIKQLYDAMTESGLTELNLKIGSDNKIKLVIDKNIVEQKDEFCEKQVDNALEENMNQVEENKNLKEIVSYKVGLFAHEGNEIKIGSNINKGDILGYVSGVGSKDYIKSTVSGVVVSIETPYGTIADYGKVLFVVEVNE